MTVSHLQNILPSDCCSLFLCTHKLNVQIIAGIEGIPDGSAVKRLSVKGRVILGALKGHHHGDHTIVNLGGIHFDPFASRTFIISINLCLNLTLQLIQTVVGG